MKKNILAIFGVIVVVVLNALVFAGMHFEQKYNFEVTSANETFATISQKLESHQDYKSTVFYVDKMEDLQEDAKKCVSTSESHLKILAELLKSTQGDTAAQLQRADLKYLSQKQVFYTQQLSECRLLVYRSREMIANYKDRIQALSTNQILRRSTPIWRLTDANAWSEIEAINQPALIKLSGFTRVRPNQWYTALLFLVITAGFVLYVRRLLKKFYDHNDYERYPLLQALIVVAIDYIVPAAVMGVFCLFLNLIFQEIVPTPGIELISHGLLLLVIGMAAARYLFYPSKTLPGLFAFPSAQGARFYRALCAFFCVLFLGYVVSVFVREQPILQNLIVLSRTLYLTLLSAVAIWIFFLWHRSPYASRFHHGLFTVFSSVFVFGLVVLLSLEWAGYHQLAIFVVQGVCYSVVCTVIAIAVWRIVNALYDWIDNNHYATARQVHQWLGIKVNKQLHEIAIVRFAAHFTILCFYFVFLMKSWGISPVFVDAVTDSFIYGFRFFGIMVVPLRLVLGCVVFAVVFIIGRLFSAALANKEEFKGEENTQIAISTIVIYVSFVVAVVVAMLVSGIDVTGLAIVAGALSVGIGLGLQTIVNNFVSGLILLLEKPIKPGDRVIIGKTEGFVRKIRIRSTQISTSSKEDVIVPNADFITQQVTNCMFRDRYSRVTSQVGVAYGSDVHLVKKVLLEIASKHEEVVQEAPNAPVVLFSKFGDNALMFDLLCVIYDVNKKSFIMSDLNFAIDAAFRANNIDIAYPQLEVKVVSEKPL